MPRHHHHHQHSHHLTFVFHAGMSRRVWQRLLGLGLSGSDCLLFGTVSITRCPSFGWTPFLWMDDLYTYGWSPSNGWIPFPWLDDLSMYGWSPSSGWVRFLWLDDLAMYGWTPFQQLGALPGHLSYGWMYALPQLLDNHFYSICLRPHSLASWPKVPDRISTRLTKNGGKPWGRCFRLKILHGSSSKAKTK